MLIKYNKLLLFIYEESNCYIDDPYITIYYQLVRASGYCIFVRKNKQTKFRFIVIGYYCKNMICEISDEWATNYHILKVSHYNEQCIDLLFQFYNNLFYDLREKCRYYVDKI